MPSDVYAAVVEIVKSEGGLRDDPPDTADIYRDLGVESTKAIAILLAVEERFSITIDDADFVKARTVTALVDLVQRLGGE